MVSVVSEIPLIVIIFVKGEHTFVQEMILFTSIMFLDAFVRAIDNRYRNI